jgi:SagB-type dehydrogenase family enzyme
VLLPKPSTRLSVDLARVLRERHTIRRFDPGLLTPANISNLLAHGIGFLGYDYSPRRGINRRRHFPSVAGRSSVECYMHVAPGAPLEAGFFHCAADCTSLTFLAPHDESLVDTLAAATGNNQAPRKSPGLMIFTYLPERLRAFAPHAEGYARLEAGHAAQNVLLVASALGIAACPIGGDIARPARFLPGHEDREAVLYAIALG